MTFYNSDPASTCDSILTLTAEDFPPQRLSVAETCPFQAEGSSQPDSSYRLILTPESGDPQTFLLRADSTGLYFYNAAAEARTQVDSEFDELTWQVFFSETQLQDYQAAAAQYPASDHSARALYPGRVLENQEPISNRFAFHLSETALSPAERQDYYHGLFWAINAESNSAFPDGEPSALTEWRAEKTSAHLIAAGYDYLLIDSDWRSFLSAEERHLLEDPRQYELVQEWAVIRQRFYLYRPLSP
jgi:hypothetical protein